MKKEDASEEAQIDRLSLHLALASGRFSRALSRGAGSSYSAIAWRVLAELERGGPARVSVLAQQQSVAQPSMTALVQRLEGEGWIERAPDPADGRAALLAVTPEGLAALGDYRRAAAARIRPLLAELTDFDRATLARAAELMERLADAPDPHGPG